MKYGDNEKLSTPLTQTVEEQMADFDSRTQLERDFINAFGVEEFNKILTIYKYQDICDPILRRKLKENPNNI